MRRFWPLLIFAAIFIYALLHQSAPSSLKPSSEEFSQQRIISLAPSITETVFAVGAQAQLVAVTDYCQYPAAAKDLPKVGGYLDPSLEHILRFQPDVVLLMHTQIQLQKQLHQLGIKTLAINHARLDGILSSISQIGTITGHTTAALALRQQLEQRIEVVTKRVAGKPKPATMLAIAHYTDSDQLHHIYLAGQQDFYNDLLNLAGGVNVYQQIQVKVPSISTEGILRLNPQVVIDLFPDASMHQADLQQVNHNWLQLKQLNAVKQDQIHLIQASYATVPGPRVVNLLEDFAAILHPKQDAL